MEISICVRSINPWGCKKVPLLPPLLISGYSVVTSLPETASEHAAGIILHIFPDFRSKILQLFQNIKLIFIFKFMIV